MTYQLHKTLRHVNFGTMARTAVFLVSALMGSEIAFAQPAAHSEKNSVESGNAAKKVSKLKKISSRIALFQSNKKMKKSPSINNKMNSSDTPGTLATGVSGVKLKKIPLGTEKSEEVSVAQ
jgi:hypothetical protein